MPYLNGRNRDTIKNTEQRLMGQYRSSFRKALRKPLEDCYIEAGKIYRDVGYVSSAVDSIDNKLDAVSESMERIYSKIMFDAVSRIKDKVNKHKKEYSRKPQFITKDIDNDLRRLVNAWILNYGAERITRINDTTRKQIRNLISRSVSDGLGMEEIADNVAKMGKNISINRAWKIARTETLSAWQGGELEAAKKIAPGMKKEWITGDDDRVRDDEFSHVESDGQIVNIDEPFIVSNEYLQHPGDPNGSAGNVINCRCVLGYVY